jgi:hypothetical protein
MLDQLADTCQSLRTIELWRNAGFERICFITQPNKLSKMNCEHISILDNVCIHEISIPMGYNYYLKDYLANFLRLSALGKKSAPNYFFFAALNLIHRIHQDDVFLLEPDVYPVNVSRTKVLLNKAIDKFDSSWVIGSTIHPQLERIISKNIRDHLNGSAIYNTSNIEFIQFLNSIWRTSLVYLNSLDNNSPFDILTSNNIIERLPAQLRLLWKSNISKFSAESGMINYSISRISEKDLQDFMSGRNIETIIRQDTFSIHCKLELTSLHYCSFK